MIEVEFSVIGNPVPKQSFRYVRGGGYQPKRVTDWRDKVSAAAIDAMRGKPPLTGELTVHISFVRDDRRKFDLDNGSKNILDAMKGIVFEDDSQVVNLHLTKRYNKGYGRANVWVRQQEE